MRLHFSPEEEEATRAAVWFGRHRRDSKELHPQSRVPSLLV